MVYILFGGGKESLLSLHKAAKKYRDITLLFFNYGQKSYSKEKKSTEYYAYKYRRNYHIIKVQISLGKGIKEGKNVDNHVTLRNTIFIAHAINYIREKGDNTLIVPFTKEKKYKDSSLKFLKDIKQIIHKQYPDFSIFSNLINIPASLSHLELTDAGVDLSHVWSCDNNGRYHCGKCNKCSVFLKDKTHIQEYLKQVKYATSNRNQS